MGQKYRIYLDVCCLNRPLDNSAQDRIRLEAEAVLLIYRKCRMGEWDLVISDAIEAEVRRTPNPQKKEQVMLALLVASSAVELSYAIQQRARDLENLGFKSFDAAHIACAEAGQVDIMLTTDDRLLRTATRAQNALLIAIKNPVNWLLEINQIEDGEDL